MIRKKTFMLAAIALAVLAGEARAQRQSGSQMTPDSRGYLINKDVGNERWAISYNLADRTVTGNVFKSDGSDPSFIWCKITSETPAANPAENQYLLDCWGADRCASAPCSDSAWTPIGTGIPISGSFLLPPETLATFKGSVEPVFDSTCASAGCHGGAMPAEELNLSNGVAYDSIFRKTSHHNPEHLLVEPFDPETSHLYHMVNGEDEPRMPLGAPPLSAETIEKIGRWILEGAARN